MESREELECLLKLLPERIRKAIKEQIGQEDSVKRELVEIVMDLERQPELRFLDGNSIRLKKNVSKDEIDFLVSSIGGFSKKNRAGIERTLHRISAIKNRKDEVIGLTCRVGKITSGTIDVIEDLLLENKSLLILGPPGAGKTSRLREIAHLYSTRLKKRVVIVDTSMEIGGEGDIPHRSIGNSRRMPVSELSVQHKVMIEAVENHMPEVVIIDEISTLEDALAAQTIAERGVILIATAHGRDLENIVKNPSLSILVGGPETVTLSDEEARRRNTQKNVQERSCPATFEIVVELVSFDSVIVHKNVNHSVDRILRGDIPSFIEIRSRSSKTDKFATTEPSEISSDELSPKEYVFRIYPYATSHSQILNVMRALGLKGGLVESIQEANLIISLGDYAGDGAKIRKLANKLNIKIETITDNSFESFRELFERIVDIEEGFETQIAIDEVKNAIDECKKNNVEIDLNPRKERLRKLQEAIIKESGLYYTIFGEGFSKRLHIKI